MDADQLLQAAAILRELGVIKPDKTDLLPVYAAIGGAIAGSVSGSIPGAIAGWYQRKKERTAILNSLLAEIRALCQIIHSRAYIAVAAGFRDDMLAAGETSADFVVMVPDHYNQVFKANLSNVGKLDPTDATDILTFYQFVDSVVLDIKPGGMFANGGATPEGLSELVKLLTLAVETADKINLRHPLPKA